MRAAGINQMLNIRNANNSIARREAAAITVNTIYMLPFDTFNLQIGLVWFRTR
jgi:hypothetical protein